MDEKIFSSLIKEDEIILETATMRFRIKEIWHNSGNYKLFRVVKEEIGVQDACIIQYYRFLADILREIVKNKNFVEKC